MPPRIPILGVFQRSAASAASQTRFISKTASAAALRRDGPSSPSGQLASFDSQPESFSPSRNATQGATDIFSSFNKRKRETPPEAKGDVTLSALQKKTTEDGFMRQMPRRWKQGDVYAPHDLSGQEMDKWRRQTQRKKDLVDLLGLRPVDMYRNFSMISEFITAQGRIKHSKDTGLRPVNQRKMAKAIRRAIGLGIHPSVHQHPEIMMRDVRNMPAPAKADGYDKHFQYRGA